MELLTAEQMRAAERAAMDSGAVTGLVLMQRAGAGCVDAMLSAWPEFRANPGHAVVLCGPGNNGGDGFVIARLLQELGWEVEVFFHGAADRLSNDARAMHDAWLEIGVLTPMSAAGQGNRPDVLVDALFGTGLTRPIPRECVQAFHAVSERPSGGHCRVMAVDAPSGMDMDSGQFLVPDLVESDDPQAFRAQMEAEVYPRMLRCDLCVTFHRPKRGHYLAEVAHEAPVVVDIGLPEGPFSLDAGLLAGDSDSERVRLVAPVAGSSRRVWLRHVAQIGSGGHKYRRGHALVLGGGVGRGGAGRLAARAALRVGAGLVTLAVPPSALQENAARLDAVMLRGVRDDDALRDLLADDRLSCVVLGPGLGVGEHTRNMVFAALESAERRVVLDADALSSFAEDPAALFAACGPHVVMTPHEGEFARLFPDLSESARRPSFAAPSLSKIDVVQEAAQRSAATILLKGEATVIASPDGQTGLHPAFYDRQVPWLGTAGAGDVLAGLIGGLLAHPGAAVGVHRAVEAAAWLHVECARSFGPGLIAEDIPDELPRVFRSLGF